MEIVVIGAGLVIAVLGLFVAQMRRPQLRTDRAGAGDGGASWSGDGGGCDAGDSGGGCGDGGGGGGD
jgi:hypothetical protein